MKKLHITFLLTLVLIISQSAKSQTLDTVAAWITWPGSTAVAEYGIPANKSISTVSAQGASNFFISDPEGMGMTTVASADSWAGGANTKGWQISISTLKFSTLKYSCKMGGENNGLYNRDAPRDFKLQYSLDGSTWTDVANSNLNVTANTTPVAKYTALTDVVLPAACENQALVYLKMVMRDNISMTGPSKPVTGAQSHIDDIKVTGISIPEAPTDIKLSNRIFIVPSSTSSAAAGTLGTFTSVDFNRGNTFTYTLAEGSGSTNNGSFTISGNTISSTASLTAGNYSIRIRSTDNSSLYYEKAFTVTVLAPDPISQGARQQVSAMGTTLGTITYVANNPVNIAYNTANNEYLSVWAGDDNHAPLVDNEFEIFGQRINANTGVKSGGMIRISFMGPDGGTTYRGLNPSVAYNATNNEYFVVWQGNHNTGSLVVGEDEIWGQRIDGETGGLLGSMVRISITGVDGSATTNAQTPDVSWNAANNQYLVVWRADEVTGGMVDNDYEVYGQRINNLGVVTGAKTRISFMGPDGVTNYVANTPAVTYDATDNQFLVVWRGDDNANGMVDNDNEIWAQMVSSNNTLLGTRLRISTMGPDGVTNYGSSQAPDVTWNSTSNQFYVVWSADDNTSPLIDNEIEIYGQLVSSEGALTGSRQRLSDMGPDGVTTYAANFPRVAYIASLNEYWVTWYGDDDFTSVDNEGEIFMQRVSNANAEVGTNDIRISFMGPASVTLYNASQSAIAFNSANGKVFVVWQGDDNTAPLIDNEFQIFGQLLFEDELLPVTWLSFAGEMQGKQTVLLNWKTASEWNSKEFVIQRSATAITWDSIGIQLAAKSSNTEMSYKFTDYKALSGNNYYRLMQKDQDGIYSYSKVILVKNQEETKLAIFPNPTTEYLTLELPNTGKSIVRIFDNSGHMIRQEQFTEQNFVVDVKGITSGVYHIQIVQKGTVYNKKFVKK